MCESSDAAASAALIQPCHRCEASRPEGGGDAEDRQGAPRHGGLRPVWESARSFVVRGVPETEVLRPRLPQDGLEVAQAGVQGHSAGCFEEEWKWRQPII